MKKPSQAIPNQRLRTERELRGWSQKYVAEQIGADHYYLSRWERGTASPSPYYRQKLCALFGKDARELGLLPDQPEKQSATQEPAGEPRRSPYLNCSARLALSQGDISTARSLAQEYAALAQAIGNQEHTAEALLVLGKCAIAGREYKTARSLFEESLALFRKMGNKTQMALCLESLAQVAAMQENSLWATRLWGCAAALREAIGSPLPPIERATYEQVVTEARKHSDEQEFAKAWEEGRRLSPEQALVSM